MGRSVSTHRHAIATKYVHLETPDDSHDLSWEWECFKEDVINELSEAIESLCPCDRWQDHEDHIVLENDQYEVSISEYCGLVAICLAPREPYEDPADPLERAATVSVFEETLKRSFQTLEPLGRFSNGEQAFQKCA